MSTENPAQNTADILASARLTPEQTEMLLVKSLLAENQELSDAVDGKSVNVLCQWQTAKGSDPESLVHIYFVDAPGEVQDAEAESDVESSEETES